AAALADHDFRSGLRSEKCRFQIDIQRFVEFIFGNVDGEIGEAATGVVDEDVELSELRGRSVDGAVDLFELGDIHLKRESVSAESFDFCDEIFCGVLIAEAEGDVGASGGESDGDGAAEPAGGARDKG